MDIRGPVPVRVTFARLVQIAEVRHLPHVRQTVAIAVGFSQAGDLLVRECPVVEADVVDAAVEFLVVRGPVVGADELVRAREDGRGVQCPASGELTVEIQRAGADPVMDGDEVDPLAFGEDAVVENCDGAGALDLELRLAGRRSPTEGDPLRDVVVGAVAAAEDAGVVVEYVVAVEPRGHRQRTAELERGKCDVVVGALEVVGAAGLAEAVRRGRHRPDHRSVVPVRPGVGGIAVERVVGDEPEGVPGIDRTGSIRVLVGVGTAVTVWITGRCLVEVAEVRELPGVGERVAIRVGRHIGRDLLRGAGVVVDLDFVNETVEVQPGGAAVAVPDTERLRGRRHQRTTQSHGPRHDAVEVHAVRRSVVCQGQMVPGSAIKPGHDVVHPDREVGFLRAVRALGPDQQLPAAQVGVHPVAVVVVGAVTVVTRIEDGRPGIQRVVVRPCVGLQPARHGDLRKPAQGAAVRDDHARPAGERGGRVEAERTRATDSRRARPGPRVAPLDHPVMPVPRRIVRDASRAFVKGPVCDQARFRCTAPQRDEGEDEDHSTEHTGHRAGGRRHHSSLRV